MAKKKNPKKKRRRGRVIDKWKIKQEYEVVAPPLFGEKVVAKSVADEEIKMLNRIFKVGLFNLTGSRRENDLYSNVKLRVVDIKGKMAHTVFMGHELSRSYLRTLTTRRHSIIDPVVDLITKDDKKLRVKSVIITVFRVSDNQKKDIRRIFREEINKYAQEHSMEEIIKDLMNDKNFVPAFVKKAKKIAPIRRVKIRKTEIPKTAIVVKKQ